MLKLLTKSDQTAYNKLVSHIIQSWEWGEFRESMGTKILRFGIFDDKKMTKAFTISIHPLPAVKKNMGYVPKVNFLDPDLSSALSTIAKQQNLAFIKIEPDIELSQTLKIDPIFKVSTTPLFTKYNFILDLTKSESELLANLNQKTRYNIKVAQKHDVKVSARVDDQAFEDYLDLYFATTKRQGYLGHNRDYHRRVWELLKAKKMARVMIAYFENKPLSAWMLLNFGDKLYYPYGGSSIEHREVMANNLVAWEAIKFGQANKLKQFDLWGAMGPNPDPKHPYFGFHRFKAGYGARHIEYLGSFDMIFDQKIYLAFSLLNHFKLLKVLILKIFGR